MRPNELDREGETKGGKVKKVTIAYLDIEYVERKSKGGKNVKVLKWSWKGKRKPSQLQEKKMIGEMMVIMTRLILENHIYQFKGKLYLQTSGGGPIGLKLTGVLARIVMHFFDQKYLDIR